MSELSAIAIVQHRWLRDVVIPVEEGKVTFLFGINNSGKSTILDAINQLGAYPREPQSWVVGYMVGQMDALQRPSRLPQQWLDDFAEASETWFSDVNWDSLRLRNRYSIGSVVPQEPPVVAFSTMFAPGSTDPTAHLLAWNAVMPSNFLTHTPVRDLDRLAGLIGAASNNPGEPDVGPANVLDAAGRVSDSVSEWADRRIVWPGGAEDWSAVFGDGPYPDKSPEPPRELFTTAPYSWLANPSSIICTLIETLDAGIVLSPFEVLRPSAESTRYSGLNTTKKAVLAVAAGSVWNEMSARIGRMAGPRPNHAFIDRGRAGGSRKINDCAFVILDCLCDAAIRKLPRFALPFVETVMVPRLTSDGADIEFVILTDREEAARYAEWRLQVSEDVTLAGSVLNHLVETSQTVSVDDLAEGVRLWIRLAIEQTTTFGNLLAEFSSQLAPVADTIKSAAEVHSPDSGGTTVSTVVVVDEPERHLHPLAQRAAADALVEFAATTGSAVIAATHSPAFLSARDGVFVHIRRDANDEVSAQQVHRDDLVAFLQAERSLGFDHGELFAAFDAYLVVEGEHELIMLEEWCADLISRIKVLPMRGTNKAAALNLELEQFMQVAPKPVGFLLDADPTLEAMATLAPEFADLPTAAERIALCKERIPGFGERLRKDKKVQKLPSWTDLLFHDHVPGTSPMVFIDVDDIVLLLDDALVGEGSKRPYTVKAATEALKDRGAAPNKEFLVEQFGLRAGVFSDQEIRRMAGECTGPGVEAFRAKVKLVTERLAAMADR